MNTNSQINLLWQLTHRDLVGKFKGSMLGWVWMIVTPLLMLGVFTLVFHGIFGMKWPGARNQSPVDFALFLFAGLTVFQFFADTVTRAPTLVISQPNLVTKVVFPLWMLPLSAVLASMAQFTVSLAVLLVFILSQYGATIHWMWLPMLATPLFAFVTGISWLLAALGVYARDTAQLTAMLTTLILFLSPVFFPMSAAPSGWQFWLGLNPLAIFMEQFRGVMLLHASPSWMSLLTLFTIGGLTAIGGYKAFTSLELGFSDVI